MRGTIDRKSWRILLMSNDLAADADWIRQLSALGWRVLEVTEPAEALAAARSAHIDLVVLHCPVGEAVDMGLAGVLRKVSPAAYLPVMILATGASKQQRCEYLDSGADEVMSDKTASDEMLARIRSLLRTKRLHDELADSKRALRQSVDRERRLSAKLRRDNAHLQALCTMDPLTGVQNTRSFRETLRHEFSVARRYDSPLSLLMMDVDHFKALNDTHGHPSGDGVLKQLAGLVKRCVRASDVVARTGGDEFAVILVKANRQQAVQLASRIHQEVSKSPFVVHGREICVEVSIGLATYPDHGEIEDPDMLVYFSDQALLEAKETGRNRLVTMDEIPEAVRSRLHRQYHHTKYTTAKLYADAEEETT